MSINLTKVRLLKAEKISTETENFILQIAILSSFSFPQINQLIINLVSLTTPMNPKTPIPYCRLSVEKPINIIPFNKDSDSIPVLTKHGTNFYNYIEEICREEQKSKDFEVNLRRYVENNQNIYIYYRIEVEENHISIDSETEQTWRKKYREYLK